ncbi:MULTISPECIES: hypothetical protein [unclassified Streptomyces]|nr:MULTISPECIES: hypothetical protein [unclassified Streptomyces]BDH69367.1 hypothetical protein MTP06_28160 [Streptomyces sp. PLM4]
MAEGSTRNDPVFPRTYAGPRRTPARDEVRDTVADAVLSEAAESG